MQPNQDNPADNQLPPEQPVANPVPQLMRVALVDYEDPDDPTQRLEGPALLRDVAHVPASQVSRTQTQLFFRSKRSRMQSTLESHPGTSRTTVYNTRANILPPDTM